MAYYKEELPLSIDVIDLRNFYREPLGAFASKVLSHDLTEIWPSVKGDDVAVLGYGLPYIAPWLEQAESLINLMPESQGVAYWPEDGANLSCLAHMDALPLADESVNRVFLAHALETAGDPQSVIQEAWRILKPQGQLLVMVPHRRGAWAHSDKTPFGAGQPYSRVQLCELLKEHGFSVEGAYRSLVAPPFKNRLSLMLAPCIERCGGFIFSRFAGVLMLQATKQVFTPSYIKTRDVRRRLVLPVPVSASPLGAGRMGS